MTTQKVKWHYSGNLQRLESRFDRGVYIFAYRMPQSEVIYVGTALSRDGFMARWSQHLAAFRRGARTVWRPVGADLRNLMSASPEEYVEFSKLGLIWIPGREVESQFRPDLLNMWTYDQWWEGWVNPHYLWEVEVFACPLESDREAKILESQLQIHLSKRNRISYYKPIASQSWLGKREVNDQGELCSVNFEFDPIPRTDSEGALLLADFSTQELCV